MVVIKKGGGEESTHVGQTLSPPSWVVDDGWIQPSGRKVVRQGTQKPCVFLPSRLVRNIPPSKGSVMQMSDGSRQLTMEIVVCPPDGEHKRLRVLIDTGAQINVVKRGLFPESSLQPARHPIMLTLADGQPFWGGDVELVANLTFGKTVDGKLVPWKSKARFYVGVIRADIILGLPWLAKNGLDVLTRDGCLGERKGCKTFLISDCPEELENSHEETQEIDTLPSHMVGCIPPKRMGWAGRQNCTKTPGSHGVTASIAVINAGQWIPDCDATLPHSSKKPHEHCVGETPPPMGWPNHARLSMTMVS